MSTRKNCTPCQLPRQSCSLSSFQWAAGAILLIGLLLSLAFFLCGCTAFQNPDGQVGIGVPLARLADTPEQILNAGADLLPPPFNYLASALLAGGTVGVLGRRSRKLIDAAFDEGAARAAAVPPVPPPVPVPVVAPVAAPV